MYEVQFSSGSYVHFNIIPDFSVPVRAGTQITINGVARISSRKVASVTVNIGENGLEQKPFANYSFQTTGAVSGKETPFVISFAMPEPPEERIDPASDLQQYKVRFGWWSSDTGYTGGNFTLNYISDPVLPDIVEFEVGRCTLKDGVYAPSDYGIYAYVKSLRMQVAEGKSAADVSAANSTVTASGHTVSLTSAIVQAALGGGYTELSGDVVTPSLLSEIMVGVDQDHTATLHVESADGYESDELSYILHRAFANMHLSGASTGGVAFGKFSSSTEGHPKFEIAEGWEVDIPGMGGDYSITEQTTGQKWIDGSPIYRRVIELGAAIPSSGNREIDLECTVGALIRVGGYGIANSSNTYMYPIPYTNTTAANQVRMYLNQVHQHLIVSCGSGVSLQAGAVAIVEYTKLITGRLHDADGNTLVDSDGNEIALGDDYTSVYTGSQIDTFVGEVI